MDGFYCWGRREEEKTKENMLFGVYCDGKKQLFWNPSTSRPRLLTCYVSHVRETNIYTMTSMVQKMMASLYQPIHNNERDIDEAAIRVAEKRAAAAAPHNTSLETVPEEEYDMTAKEGVVAAVDRYDGSDTDVDLGSGAQTADELEGMREEEEESSLFGLLKPKKHATAAAAWGCVSPAERLMRTRRLGFNAPAVIVLSLFFNFLLILVLGVLTWKILPPRTKGRPPDELVYSESLPSLHPPRSFFLLHCFLSLLFGVGLKEAADLNGLTSAPLEDLIELQAQNYWVGLAWGKDYPESPYQGWPTDEIDALWDKYDGKNVTQPLWEQS